MNEIISNRVFVIDNALNEIDCEKIISQFDEYEKQNTHDKNGIIFNRFFENKNRANEYFEMFANQLRDIIFTSKDNRRFKIASFRDKFTITRIDNKHITTRHIDEQFANEQYKFIVYLNACENGGTIFHYNNEQIIVENVERRGVLFDMSIEHETQRMNDDEIKYAISFRCVIEHVDDENNVETPSTIEKIVSKIKRSTRKKQNA